MQNILNLISCTLQKNCREPVIKYDCKLSGEEQQLKIYIFEMVGMFLWV